MKKWTIRKVKEFYLGQLLVYEGQKYRITSFPTRTSVVFEAVYPLEAQFCHAKTTIKDIREHAQIGGHHVEVEVGDTVTFDYFEVNDMKGWTGHRAHGLIVEKITLEWDKGQRIWMATARGTKYALDYCTIEKKWNE